MTEKVSKILNQIKKELEELRMS